jgi:hypothetical protein
MSELDADPESRLGNSCDPPEFREIFWAVLRKTTDDSSSPGLTRRSIFFEKELLAKKMDT